MESIDVDKVVSELDENLFSFKQGVQIPEEDVGRWKKECVTLILKRFYQNPKSDFETCYTASGNTIIILNGYRICDGEFRFHLIVSDSYVESEIVVQDDNYIFRTDEK